MKVGIPVFSVCERLFLWQRYLQVLMKNPEPYVSVDKRAKGGNVAAILNKNV